MPPRLLLAPAGHGKTEYLVQRIRKILSDEPFGPALVIVPNGWLLPGERWALKSTHSTHSTPNC